MKSLMDMAQARAGGANASTPAGAEVPPGEQVVATPEGDRGTTDFKRPNIAQFIPPEMKDVVDRVVAAGIKMMSAIETRQELQQIIESQDPAPKKLAESITGLMLVLDQKSKGGIPQAAIFPAAAELLGEGAEVLTAAGQPVSQQDYNDAALMMFGLIGQKLGAKPEELMGAAEQAIGGAPAEQAPQGGMQPPQGMMPAAPPAA